MVTAGNAFSVTTLTPCGSVSGATAFIVIVLGFRPSLSAVITMSPVSKVELIIARSFP